jgi:anti-sigma-K factor RskA
MENELPVKEMRSIKMDKMDKIDKTVGVVKIVLASLAMVAVVVLIIMVMINISKKKSTEPFVKNSAIHQFSKKKVSKNIW